MFKNTLRATAFASTLLMGLGVCVTNAAEATSVSENLNVKNTSTNNDTSDEVTNYNTGKVKEVLNFREGPSTDYKIIEVFEEGTEVKILSEDNGWYKIENENGQVGWSYAKYIEVANQEEDNTNGILESSANLRKGASTNYKVIEVLKKGEKVNVISQSNDWYKVKCLDGQLGWVHSSHIETSFKSQISSSNTLEKSSETSAYGSVKRSLVVKATAYSGDSITATGTTPKWGTIAVDPSVIPYGSKVYIPRFGKVFIAEDCGGGIKGNRIDIFMNSESQCNNWGVRSITVKILK